MAGPDDVLAAMLHSRWSARAGDEECREMGREEGAGYDGPCSLTSTGYVSQGNGTSQGRVMLAAVPGEGAPMGQRSYADGSAEERGCESDGGGWAIDVPTVPS